MSKLLSHRLRGYSRFEHTLSALRKACRGPEHYLEVDTRASRDGDLFVYHNPTTGSELGRRLDLRSTSTKELSTLSYAEDEPFVALDEFLRVFKEESTAEHQLCIDIKDYGFESRHVEAVRRRGLEQRVTFVSWIPQTLCQIHRIDPGFPLILSHWNLHRLGALGRGIERLVAGLFLRLHWFVVMGRKRYLDPLGTAAQGYQHTLVTSRLPDDLARVLRQSAGGICVHKVLLSKTLASYCSESGLQLWVFGACNLAEYRQQETDPAIDVVFCDFAPDIIQPVEKR